LHTIPFKNVANGYTLDWKAMAQICIAQKAVNAKVAESTAEVAESTEPVC
jgi:hypothetical protein